MVISSRQLKMTEGKMKQFVELLEGKNGSFEATYGEMKQLDN